MYSEEERALLRIPHLKVLPEHSRTSVGERDHALLIALSLKNTEPADVEVEIGEVEGDKFRAADAGIEQDHQHGAVAQPDLRLRVAAVEQPDDLFAREGLDDLLWQADIAESAERVLVENPTLHQPVEEATHLAEIAVAGGVRVADVAAEIGIEMGGLYLVYVLRKALLASDPEEPSERLAVGARRPWGHTFDFAAEQVELDERLQSAFAGLPRAIH